MNRNPAEDNDIALVNACIGRDIKAWAVFVKKYSFLISNAAKNRLRKYGIKFDYHDIEDIKQSAISAIWLGNKLEGVKGKADIRYWLAIVAGNEALNYAKQKTRRQGINGVSMDAAGEGKGAEEILGGKSDTIGDLARRETLKKIEAEIEQLNPKEKLITKLSLLYGKNYDEISEILRLPRGTIASYLKRAKDRLRERLKDYR